MLIKRPLLFISVSLILGAIAGFSFLLLEKYAARELLGVLADEIRASGDYDLVYDSAELNLLRLKARAKNVRIISNQTKENLVFVKTLEASFNLSRISNRIADLTELKLINGDLNGVGPDSAIYNVVDYLAAPVPPENDRPDRFKIKLQRLTLTPASAVEKIGEHNLQIKDLELQLARNESDNFDLHGSIREAALQNGQGQFVIPAARFSDIDTDIYLADDYVSINSLKGSFTGGNLSSSLKIQTKNNDTINGDLNLAFNAESLNLNETLEGTLKAEAELAGNIERPEVKAALSSESLKIKSDLLEENLEIKKLQASFLSYLQDGTAIIENLSSDPSASLKVELAEPLKITQNGIDGTVRLKAPEVNTIQGKFTDIDTKIDLNSGITADFAFNPPAGLLEGRISGDCRYFSDKLLCQLKSDLLKASLDASFPKQSLPQIDSFELNLEKPDKLKISSHFSGPANILLLKGTGQFETRSGTNTISADINLEDGHLSVKSTTGSPVIISAGSDFHQNFKTRVEISANDYQIFGKKDQSENCNKASARSELAFQDLNPDTLTGYIEISAFDLGCAPYNLRLKEAIRININALKAVIPESRLSSQYGDIRIAGEISKQNGFNISAKGDTSLAALIPFVPDADELSGQLKLDASLKGALNSPKIAGVIEAEKGIFETSSPAVEAHQITGRAEINEEGIKIRSLSAELNGGKISADGELLFSHLNSSELKASFDHVYFQPIDDSELVISGNISLINSEVPTIKGEVEVESFEIVKKLNIISTLKNLPFELISAAPQKLTIEKGKGSSDMNLDLKVHADDAIFLDSNFAQIEAKADLHLSGNAANPAIAGEVEVLQGWFGLRDRRFEIGSGKAIFSPDSQIPKLEILAESSVITRHGENIVIFASITGSALAPVVKLDSDRGYTEKEILNLLTSGSDISFSGNSLNVFPQNDDINLPFLSDDSFFGLGRWIRRLTRIDSVSIEPTFNARDGVVEPMLVAEKQLSPDFLLRGETSFGGSSYNTRARLNYGLTQRTTVSGIIESLSSQEVTTLGVDVSYAFKPLKSLILNIDIRGSFLISKDSILDNLKLNEDSRVTADSLARLENNLKQFYFDQGFMKAECSFVCTRYNSRDICENLKILISEGDKLEFSGIEISGDPLPENLTAWFNSVKDTSGTATTETRNNIGNELVARLRNEGFIRARIQSEYKDEAAKLLINLSLGKPVSFTFKGNSHFSDLELLESINFFTRKQPFGNNTINLLTRNITQLYRQDGYLEAEVSWQDLSSDESRQDYLVSITENMSIRLNKVRFSIEGELREKDIRQISDKYLQKEASKIFRPKRLLFSNLEENCQILSSMLKAEGYDLAAVDYDLNINELNGTADLIYNVKPGSLTRFSRVAINGLPDNFSYQPPEVPISAYNAGRFTEELRQSLVDAGYFESIVSSEPQQSTWNISVIAKEAALISSVKIEGLNDIPAKVVQEKIPFRPGDIASPKTFAEVRSRILQTGLFSKVSISQEGQDLSRQDIVIRVEERNLQAMQVGAGINSEYGFHIFGAMTDRELFSDGRTLSARVDSYLDELNGSISQGVISLNYSDPEFIDNNIGAVNDLRFQRLDLSSQEFDLDRLSHAFYLYKNFDEYISASLGHTIKFDNLDNVSEGAILDPEYDSGSVRLGFLNSKFLFDYRDNPLNPRRGYALTFSPQLALKALGSEAEFANLELRFQKIFDLDGILDDFDLAYTNRLASAWTLGDLDYIPITERFYAGGRNSVRGFRENSLGPVSADGTVIGGDQLVSQSLELRYFIIEDATLNLFLDSAKLALRDYHAERGEDLRYSAGVGARYLSPIGPMGFDVGFPLDEKSGEPSVRLHFSIGTSF